MPVGTEVGLNLDDIELDGDPAPPKKGHSPSIFGPHLLRPNGWKIKLSLAMEVGLGPGNFVLDGDPVPLPKKVVEPPPQFLAHVHCGRTAGWIKMALGMKVGLGAGHIVLDGDPAPITKNGA